jgi:hypothetical protein
MAIEATVLVPWRQVWHRPRMAVREAIAHPSAAVFLAPLASGIVQSLMQAESSHVGQRGASIVWILGFGTLVGSAWGLLQLHLLAGLLWVVARNPAGKRVGFRQMRTAIAVAYTPLGAALMAWVLASLLLGSGLYADPAILASLYGPATALEVALLFFATVICLLWSMVLQVLAVAEVRESSVASALATYLQALVLFAGVVLVLVVVFVTAAVVIR